MKYRPEIDGLRAVAVLPVILFHAGFGYFSGGYVGVDIFFVISGYLITTILINELDAGKFSIARFYERRARRILPALLLVMLVCLPAAWFIMLPAQLEELGWNAMAVSLFVSNIALWLNTDYFAASAELNPLLHTWSLAVEEQFYIFFPLLLWAMWRTGGRRPFLTVVLGTVLSFLLSEWGWRNAPDASFYLLPFRAWELGIGSICAFLLKERPTRNNNSLAFIGLGLIAYSIFAYSNETPFPSVWALAPVLGSALIILYCTHDSLLGRALAWKPVVSIGLISYSAYLWHQPLFAFTRLSMPTQPSAGFMATLSIATLGLAYLTWRFVENPFRSQNRQPPVLLAARKRLFVASGVGLGVFVSLGLFAYESGGFPARTTLAGTSYQDLNLDERLRANYGLSDLCRGFNPVPECRTGEQPRVVLWGDSNAMHLGPALVHSPSAPEFVQFTMSACGPFYGLAALAGGRYDARFGQRCIEFNDQVIDYISENNIELVVASSAMRPTIRRLYTREGETLPERSLEAVIESMRETTERVEATGAKIVWVSPPPTNGDNLSNCAIQAVTQGRASDDQCRIPLDGTRAANPEVMEVLAAARSFVPVVSLSEMLCDSEYCSTLLGGNIVYRDEGHLSIEGARLLGERHNFARELRRASRRPLETSQQASRGATPRLDRLGAADSDLLDPSEQFAYIILPQEIRFGFRFELTSERLFESNGELRRGLLMSVPDHEGAEVFSAIERGFKSAGYLSSRGRKEDSKGQTTDFFSKDGAPTLYVRTSPAAERESPGAPKTQIWISWPVSTR